MGQHLQDPENTPKMGRHLLKLSDKRKIWDGTFRTPVFGVKNGTDLTVTA
jgi:hypothetical protein